MYNTIWYDTLAKPFMTPPPEIFSAVWIILYITILTSLIIYTITRSRKNKALGYIYFLIQLIFNIVWAPVFFIMENIMLALVIIIFIDIFTLLTIKEFYKVSRKAAIILIPYFIWIIFATYLNITLLILN